jgi:hypothetical protein
MEDKLKEAILKETMGNGEWGLNKGSDTKSMHRR